MKKPTKAKAKARAKASGRKQKAPSQAEKIIPTHLPPTASFVMGLHDVIKVVKMIEKHDQLASFARKMKSEKAEVRIPADTVNLVKDFVAEKKLHKNAIGKHIINARDKRPTADTEIRTSIAVATGAVAARGPDGDPNRCNMGQVEGG
ncbi:hypothetical protein AB7645_09165 [Bradyrhizobium sp. 956_D2_N1_5]|jgi:hypothetical protein|uniref:hypothetical protein n=1 Tax=unclassified Bradyrhizobium TaxID=2631580 RepID=UPI003F2953A2